MFSLNDSLTYWLYSKPTDMRKSFHTLSGIVNNEMGQNPSNGDVYIFINKRRNRMKLLHWEPGGMVIYSKMLDKGTFAPPRNREEDEISSSLEWRELVLIVEGIIADPNSRKERLDKLKNIW